MTGSPLLKVSMSLLLIFSVVCLGSCNGGGGGGDDKSKAAELNETSAAESLAWIEETVPGCTVVEAAPAAAFSLSVVSMAETFNQESVVARLLAKLAGSAVSGGYQLSAVEETDTIEGDCGGALTITSSHDKGTTAYTIEFVDFCVLDEEADPPAETKINGKLLAREIGNPSNDGPVISEYTAETDGKLTVVTDGESISATLDDFSFSLGAPGVEPGVPTLDHPDVLTLANLTIDFETQGKTHKLTNVDADLYESGADTVLDLNSARYSAGDRGYVDVSTTVPLVMNADGELVSGAVELEGDKGNVILVTLTEGEDSVFEITVNGTALNQCLDCSSIDLDFSL